MIIHIDITKQGIDIVLTWTSLRVLKDRYNTVLGQLGQQLVKKYHEIDIYFIFSKISKFSMFDHLYRKNEFGDPHFLLHFSIHLMIDIKSREN